MIKVVKYKRVSTKSQGESGLGLEAQDEYLKHFVTPDKYETVQEFVEVASAKSMDCKKRPILCDAIALCIQHGYTLAVAKVDRLSRVTAHALAIYAKLDGRLIACDVPNLDKFTLTIFMAIADRETLLIGLRTKGALEAKVKRLQANGEPTNWRINPKQVWSDEARAKSQAAIKESAASNENTLRAIDYAKMLRVKGMTVEAIANYLNERKFLTPRGKAFQKTSVLRLLEK